MPDELDTEREASRIAELVGQDRLEEAAELAAECGHHVQAAELWERACRWDKAAESALAAAQPARALVHAARARRADLERAAIDAAVTASAVSSAASACERAGFTVAAGHVLFAGGLADAAAPLFERGGAWLEAGAAHERAGAMHHAQRCFERALQADPECQEARLRLGAVLVDRAPEAAARLLQQIPSSSLEGPRGMVLLERALERLGLPGAAAEVARRRASLGISASNATTDALPDGAGVHAVLFGRYRVLERVATTPTAKVYHAVDVLTNTEVAVKVFATATLRETGRDALKRFEREAQILGGLHHPAIVPLVDYVPQGPAVVLRWMPGGSLADAFAAGPLSPARAAEVVIAVLAALGEAHRRGILHRDIKPANVLFDAAGAAHLADFGTAHVSDSAATVTTGIIGTLAYMAPEQRAGRPATIQSDLYGAGALFWHALTGAPPDAALPALSRDLGPAHLDAARRLIGRVEERPADAAEARRLVAELEWPRRIPEAPRGVAETRVVAPALSTRFTPIGDGRHHDSLLERAVLIVEATPELLRRALPFAHADHPVFASILSYDGATLRIESLDAPPLDRSPSSDELASLADALARLHGAGGVHGAVDRAHLHEQGGMLRLAFALDPAGKTAADDVAALEALR